MKKTAIMVLLLLTCQLSHCQKMVKITTVFGVSDKELRDILFFEDLDLETLTFDSPDIKDRDYEINLTEYKTGKAGKRVKLFDSTSSEFFKSDSTSLTIKFFSKVTKEEVDMMVVNKHYRSKKQTFRLLPGKGRYVMKDFQGGKDSINAPLEKEFPILAMITPTIHKDGSGSYCEVAYSEVAPENFGKKFNIPHYFMITMKFK